MSLLTLTTFLIPTCPSSTNSIATTILAHTSSRHWGASFSVLRIRIRKISALSSTSESEISKTSPTVDVTMSSQAGSSKKRKLESESSEQQSTTKAAKIHPFFTKQEKGKEKKTDGTFQWLDPLGPTSSCLHGINLSPKASSKVAALDLDGTIIKSEFGNKSAPGKAPSWSWWRASMPEKLKELHESGYAVVLISNQALKPAALATWKEKIPLIGQALSDIPFRILAASQKDQFRKPMPGMWTEVERIFKAEGVQIDKAASFFVGDAAGRQYGGKSKGDFSSTDRKWAQNVGLEFFTPEEYFLKLARHENFTMPGFQASSVPQLPLVTPTSLPIIPHRREQEVVLFVGYPCLGKSTFYRRYFQSEEYLHINQDTLKTRDKCVKALQEALKEGKSCVIDNTNRNASTRKAYLDICKTHSIKTRCFVFTGSFDLAWHNNLYRAFNIPPSAAAKEPERSLLPYAAFTGFRDNYEEPALSEGFSEIKRVNWAFEGTEEEKRHWLMWLQIDGK